MSSGPADKDDFWWNVWNVDYNRWTNCGPYNRGKQDTFNPFELSYDEAKELYDRLVDGGYHSSYELKKLKPKSLNVYLGTNATSAGQSIAIGYSAVCLDPYTDGKIEINTTIVSKVVENNYICSACGNEKCNTSESSCWLCGFKFKK